MISIIVSYLPYTLVTAFTPGPNNIVALCAVSQSGWRGGKNVLAGIAVGFLCVMVICALLCYELAKFVPSAAGVLKYVGAAYIAYLALHIARSKQGGGTDWQISFMYGFLLEFVNVKIIMYAVTVYTSYVIPHGASLGVLLVHALMLTITGIAGNLTWAAAGGTLQKFLKQYHRPFNAAMALVLLWCAASLAFDI